MKNEEYRIESGSYQFLFRIEEAGAVITGYEGLGSRMWVPDEVSLGERSYPFVKIEKKALLANKSLREISMPGSIASLEDWALAQCENMQTVIFRSRGSLERSFGRGVFDRCNHIQNICIGSDQVDDLSALLGAVIHKMPAQYLLRDEELGKPSWYQKWDQCLLNFLKEPDVDGYTDMVLCGEEDIFYQEPDFAVNKRKRKCALSMLRLLHPTNLEESVHNIFMDYLLEHTKGCKSEEAWQVILEEYGEQVAYYELLASIGGITKENIDAMLADMGERFAEAKAYMLSYKQSHYGDTEDAFSIFEL